MEEDMQKICDLLLKALQATRSGSGLVNLIYAVEPQKETVTAVFQTGRKQIINVTINVTGDSGITMIYDIMRYFRR